jgi:hypothetical protein
MNQLLTYLDALTDKVSLEELKALAENIVKNSRTTKNKSVNPEKLNAALKDFNALERQLDKTNAQWLNQRIQTLAAKIDFANINEVFDALPKAQIPELLIHPNRFELIVALGNSVEKFGEMLEAELEAGKGQANVVFSNDPLKPLGLDLMFNSLTQFQLKGQSLGPVTEYMSAMVKLWYVISQMVPPNQIMEFKDLFIKLLLAKYKEVARYKKTRNQLSDADLEDLARKAKLARFDPDLGGTLAEGIAPLVIDAHLQMQGSAELKLKPANASWENKGVDLINSSETIVCQVKYLSGPKPPPPGYQGIYIFDDVASLQAHPDFQNAPHQ